MYIYMGSDEIQYIQVLKSIIGNFKSTTGSSLIHILHLHIHVALNVILNIFGCHVLYRFTVRFVRPLDCKL